MTLIQFEKSYWDYYLMLEEKFLKTVNYVALSECNYDTYSNEYAHLMQVIGSELDCFWKFFCNYDQSAHKTISDYIKPVLNAWPSIRSQGVKAEKIQIFPFDGWDLSRPKESLFWWTAFDRIKHSRVANATLGSMKNTLFILAALYMMEMKWFKITADSYGEPDIIGERSKLFVLEDWPTRFISLSGAIAEVVNS